MLNNRSVYIYIYYLLPWPLSVLGDMATQELFIKSQELFIKSQELFTAFYTDTELILVLHIFSRYFLH